MKREHVLLSLWYHDCLWLIYFDSLTRLLLCMFRSYPSGIQLRRCLMVAVLACYAWYLQEMVASCPGAFAYALVNASTIPCVRE